MKENGLFGIGLEKTRKRRGRLRRGEQRERRRKKIIRKTRRRRVTDIGLKLPTCFPRKYQVLLLNKKKISWKVSLNSVHSCFNYHNNGFYGALPLLLSCSVAFVFSYPPSTQTIVEKIYKNNMKWRLFSLYSLYTIPSYSLWFQWLFTIVFKLSSNLKKYKFGSCT